MSLRDALARRREMEAGVRWATPIFDNVLWLGSGRDASNAEQLRAHGITHVLNAADDVPNFHEHDDSLGLTYMCLGITDFGGDAGSARCFPRAAAFVRAALGMRAGKGGSEDAGAGAGRVLVHCANGSNRSVTVVLALCMDVWGLSLKQAWAAVKARRPSSQPLRDNQAQLLEYERKTRGSNTLGPGTGRPFK